MKRVLYLSLSLCMLFVFNPGSYAQTLDAENTYTITGKSKRGTLGDASYDAGQGIYSLVYVTKVDRQESKIPDLHFRQ